jgi:hypothetical protein
MPDQGNPGKWAVYFWGVEFSNFLRDTVGVRRSLVMKFSDGRGGYVQALIQAFIHACVISFLWLDFFSKYSFYSRQHEYPLSSWHEEWVTVN